MQILTIFGILFFQKYQTNLLCHRNNCNGNTSEQKIKKCLGGSQNNMLLNENKSLDQTYLQKKGSKRSLNKIRQKSRKPVIIDLTGDDEINIPCKVKRKRTKRNSECLRVIKNIMRSKKHINSLKYSDKLINADVKECSNEDKSLEKKIRLECKPIYDIKIKDSTENCTSVSSRSSLNDDENEKQHNYNLNYLKSPMFVDQNIKEFKVTANVLKKSKLENCVSSNVTIGNATSSYNNSITQNKKALTSQEESAMETISLFKTCQNNIADQHSFKQELPTSTNCNTMQKSHKCRNRTMPVDVHDIKHIMKKLKSIKDHSSQITEIIKQKVCHQVNECQNCTKIDCEFIFTNNDIAAAKAQGTLHNTFNDNENDIKLVCDSNTIYTLSDRNKCVRVVNYINDECVMTVHAEKKMQCLDKSNDTCTVSTTFTEDQIVEPPMYNQHVNFDNVRMNDYDNAAKYSEAMIKEQQKRTDCDSSILNDRLHSSESCTFDINSFDIGSNTEVDYNLKSFPKIEETDEITKTDYIDDLEHINFLNNIPNETLLDDFFPQSSEQPQINYDSLTGAATKKSLMYTDNDITTVKTQDNLHNIFADENDVKIPYDTSIINAMLNDRDKCIYVANHTVEHMTTSAEKRMQCLNNSNDMCTVSTTFTGDQIVESSSDSQRINSDNRRKCDYENVHKYSEDTMKEQQGRSDISISNEQLHSSEFCTFDIDSFEIDSKEDNEIMKTDCINDFENISFSHNIQTETLEDILSNDTTNFLPLKQSLFELDNVYTDTSINEKNVLCNQNDAIDSSIDPVISHLNADNTFLRLPAKSNKSMSVNRNKKFHHNAKYFC